MKINQFKTYDGRNAYVDTLNMNDDVVRMIAIEVSSNEGRVRALLQSGKTIYGKQFKYVPLMETMR